LSQSSPDLETLFTTAQVLGAGSMPVKDVIAENATKLAKLNPFDPIEVAASFAGLLTAPELQSNCIRLETLVHLALVCCRGHKKPRSSEIAVWFTEFGDTTPGRMEDPAEDVFVSNIATPRGNFRILEGVWESAAFYLERIVNVAEGMPKSGGYERLRDSIYALLALSDAVCNRAGLTRNQLGNQTPEDYLPGRLTNSLSALRRRIRFTFDELKISGISIDALGDFVLNPADREKLPDESMGHTTLERFPVLLRDRGLLLVLPTATSVAIRRLVIESMMAGGMREALTRAFPD
jgi:hypothetical protein